MIGRLVVWLVVVIVACWLVALVLDHAGLAVLVLLGAALYGWHRQRSDG